MKVSLDYVKQLTHQLKMDIEEAKTQKTQRNGIILKQIAAVFHIRKTAAVYV